MNQASKIQLFFIIGILFGVLLSCDRSEELPPETYLEYRGAGLMSDTSGNMQIQLNFYFEDGDGNIGIVDGIDRELVFDTLYKEDSIYNFFVLIYDSVPGEGFEQMKTLDYDSKPVYFKYGIGPFDIVGSLKGMIDLTIPYSDIQIMSQISNVGIVRFEAFLYDWDYVKSNVVTTDKFLIGK